MDPFLKHTRSWVEKVVIGLNLCPFAGPPHRRNRIRYVLEESEDPGQLTQTLLQELAFLVDHPPEEVETTLIIHPHVFRDFASYNDYIGEAEWLIRESGLEGILQVATFHPDYQFENTSPDDPANFTNRSPYPMLHLLREASIERALADYENPEDIPERNIETMRKLGTEGIRRLWEKVLEE